MPYDDADFTASARTLGSWGPAGLKVHTMMTNGSGIQKTLMDRVYDLTGFAVEVMTDQSLQVRASLRSAGPGQPGHLICLGPCCESQADYWVAIECMQLLRMWAVPYEEQVAFQPDEQKQLYLANQLERLKTYKRHPREIITGMAQRLFSGVLLQVRSYPVELRANKALIREFPALGQQQRVAVMSMLQENSRTLAPEVKSIATAQVYEANVSMNAAFAAFWASEWSDASVTLPYEAAGVLNTGKRLLGILDACPDQGGKEDRALIDAWAEQFHVRTWYDWTPKSGRVG
jgi:hypothetical protein